MCAFFLIVDLNFDGGFNCLLVFIWKGRFYWIRSSFHLMKFLIHRTPFHDPEAKSSHKGENSNDNQLDVQANMATVQETCRRCDRLLMKNEKYLWAHFKHIILEKLPKWTWRAQTPVRCHLGKFRPKWNRLECWSTHPRKQLKSCSTWLKWH